MDEGFMPRVPYLTTRAHNAFARAHDIADQGGHAEVTPIHLGIAIMGEKGTPLAALHNLGVPFDALERELSQHLPTAGTPRAAATARSWTAWDQQVIESAREEAREMETEFYSTEHLLLALVRD